MITNYLENNHLILIGKVASEKKVSHEIYGERFYTFNLEVPRLSEISDLIPITISERLITSTNLEIGTKVIIEGQFRSYNGYENEKSKLILTVFAKDIKIAEELEEQEGETKKEQNSNEVVLNGYICKKPIYRQTPFGREIADILLAVNRTYNKSDYIPCIAWGRNARFAGGLEVGAHLQVSGRVQSREYTKKIGEEEVERRVAYEVSVSKIDLVEDEE